MTPQTDFTYIEDVIRVTRSVTRHCEPVLRFKNYIPEFRISYTEPKRPVLNNVLYFTQKFIF